MVCPANLQTANSASTSSAVARRLQIGSCRGLLYVSIFDSLLACRRVPLLRTVCTTSWVLSHNFHHQKIPLKNKQQRRPLDTDLHLFVSAFPTDQRLWCPLVAARSPADMSVPGSMSKISTVNTGRNLNINAGSAWARGPPATSTPSAPSNQPPNPTAATSTSATVPPAVPRPTNGQPSHSRRSSAAFPNTHQPPPAALKDPVAVSKSAGTYIFCFISLISHCPSCRLGFFQSHGILDRCRAHSL